MPLLLTPRGKSTSPQCQVLEALFYIVTEGCTWRGLPAEFGHWHTIYMRLDRWAKASVLERVVVELQCDLLAALSLDSTIIKFHAHGTHTLRNRGAKRSDGRVACPWLDQGAA